MAESTTANAANSNSSFGGANTLVMMGLLLAFFYFMVIRPENKKKKEQEALRNSLRKGDKIITIGGIMGKIVDVKDDKIVIETGEDQVRMELQ
ncbi:MAG: preprotein translocase subunit YajC, partial [Oscillospiraceae bacterium]|nr:preprotein translocase subunit YajC [Oscillospiraceae bacterium]